MALAPFFERVYSALGAHLSVSRDDLAKALQDVVIGLRCAPTLSQNDQWIAELTANLLARLYPRIAIVASRPFDDTLQELILKINPSIEIVQEAPSEHTIGVGRIKSGASLFPSAMGWVAYLRQASDPSKEPNNPYSSGAAATFAVAELFRRVFLRAFSKGDVAVSLLRFDSSTGRDLELLPSKLEEVLFVGVGAVGNAAIWALSKDQQITGRLKLVDGEQLELSNLQRYVLGSLSNVSKQKVQIAGEALSHTRLSLETFPLSLEDFASQNAGIGTPVMCISVDNVATRRTAQALLPRLIVNGWTGELSLGASWHIFSREAACLACLYHPHSQGISQTDLVARSLGFAPDRAALLWVTRQPLSNDDIRTAAKTLGVSSELLDSWKGKTLGDLYTDVVCGAAPISLPLSNRIETVPLAHQSVLAGILMAAELIKRINPRLSALSQPETLVSWDDVLQGVPSVWAKPRARENGCICGDEAYQQVYHSRWEATKDLRSA